MADRFRDRRVGLVGSHLAGQGAGVETRRARKEDGLKRLRQDPGHCGHRQRDRVDPDVAIGREAREDDHVEAVIHLLE